MGVSKIFCTYLSPCFLLENTRIFFQTFNLPRAFQNKWILFFMVTSSLPLTFKKNLCHIIWTWKSTPIVATPLWGKCEDETRTSKSGNLESFGTPKTSELDYRGQNTLPWSVLYIAGKILKYRCQKWPCMSHSDICSTSYGQKKSRESNWQFDSQPLKVGNRPDPGVCRWSATHRWKAFEKSYKFALDLIPIKGLSWELWASKVSGVQTGTILGLLRNLETKSHSDVGAVGKRREYYMGEGCGFPRVRAVVSQVSPCCPWLVSTPRVISNVN